MREINNNCAAIILINALFTRAIKSTPDSDRCYQWVSDKI